MVFLHNKQSRGFTLIELLVVIAIIGILASIILTALGNARGKSRDADRISEIKQIRYALELYYGKFNQYPTCLTAGGTCTTLLQGAGFINSIPTDPSTGTAYSYAATGAGTSCTGYHLGVVLEDYTLPALKSDSDALSSVGICTGSNANFDGTSHGATGAQCNTTGATAQPSNSAGENCYDITQ